MPEWVVCSIDLQLTGNNNTMSKSELFICRGVVGVSLLFLRHKEKKAEYLHAAGGGLIISCEVSTKSGRDR
jgi:hypothetical protein